MKTRKLVVIVAGALVAGLALAVGAGAMTAGTSGLPQGSEPVKLDPADFTTKIDKWEAEEQLVRFHPRLRRCALGDPADSVYLLQA